MPRFHALRIILPLLLLSCPGLAQKTIPSCVKKHPDAGCFNYSLSGGSKVKGPLTQNQSYSVFYKNSILIPISGLNFSHADLGETILAHREALNVNFSHANLKGLVAHRVNFKGSNFHLADLRGAKLYQANFSNTDLTHADFTGADLTLTDFSGAKIKGAIFKDTTLLGSNLKREDL